MKYKIFYNEDCQKYGVQKRVNDYMGERWVQILIHNNREVPPFQVNGKKVKCYTPYKGVAQRWLKELIA